MTELIRVHLVRYPKMQIADTIKLLFQSEFAGGHMIYNPADALRRLEAECLNPTPRGSDTAFEDIGGGLCRIYLGALPALSLSPQTVNRLFVATASTVEGSPERFAEKLDSFVALCRVGALPFDAEEADTYVRDYRAQGCPPLSHSDAYRAAYAPAYRVVKAPYCRFLEVFQRIDALLQSKSSIVVAIDGNSGSGKSTLAALVSEVYDCNVFHTDDFFLTQARKTAERLAEPGGNVDYERLRDELIAGLKSGGPFQYRRYDCRSGVLSAPADVTLKQLSIVEGVYSLHPALAAPYDLKLFLKTGSAMQRQRILERSGTVLLKRFDEEWIPLENRYFEALRIEKESDLVINTEFA